MRPRQAEEIHPRENNTSWASKQAPGEDVAKNEDMFLKLKAFQTKEPGFCTLADSKHLVNEVKKKKYWDEIILWKPNDVNELSKQNNKPSTEDRMNSKSV